MQLGTPKPDHYGCRQLTQFSSIDIQHLPEVEIYHLSFFLWRNPTYRHTYQYTNVCNLSVWIPLQITHFVKNILDDLRCLR